MLTRSREACHFLTCAADWMAGIVGPIGCSKETTDRAPVYPVEGQLVLNGKPLADAFVVFHPKPPVADKVLPARGKSDAQGKFQLTTYDTGDGAAVGEYVVTVQKYQLQKTGESYAPGPNVLSPAIAVPQTSPLKAKVAAEANQVARIEIR